MLKKVFLPLVLIILQGFSQVNAQDLQFKSIDFSNSNFYGFRSFDLVENSSPVFRTSSGVQHYQLSSHYYTTHFNTDSLYKKKWYNTTAFNIGFIPAVLITAGLATWNSREDLRYLRNRFIPHFENKIDDVTQYIPGMMVYGLNLAGVEGRHTVGRATKTLLIGGGMAATLVFIGKNTTNVLRPDGSKNNSFPSGHTTTAFTFATFLHKEYGHRSPFYSIVGYSLATWTGVFRQLNNRHWSSDVMVGAGIGILFTNLGYVIGDKIWGEKGLNVDPEKTYYDRELGKPSFFNVKLGFSTATAKIDEFKDEVYFKDGFTASMQGAYFFNEYIGIGAEVALVSFIVNSDNVVFEDPEVSDVLSRVETEPVGSRSPMIGPYFNFPVNDDLAVTAKLVAGYSIGARGLVYGVVRDELQEEFGYEELPIIEYAPDDTFTWSAGVSLKKMIGRNVGMSLFTDFSYLRPNMTYSEITNFDPDDGTYTKVEFEREKINMDHISVGLTVTAMLW